MMAEKPELRHGGHHHGRKQHIIAKFSQVLEYNRGKTLMHTGHYGQRTDEGHHESCNKGIDRKQVCDEAGQRAAGIASQRSQDNQFKGHHDKQYNSGCEYDLQDIGHVFIHKTVYIA